MQDKIDICVFMHKEPPWIEKNLAALRANTHDPYELIVVCEPGSAHTNINRCLDRSRSRRVVIMDDDCCITAAQPNWLSMLDNVFQECQWVGMIVPQEIKDEKTLRDYEQDPSSVLPGSPDIEQCAWLPGYLMAFDRFRIPDLRADEEIPFATGMSDLDLSLQVRFAGYSAVKLRTLAVYHPWKHDPTKQAQNAREFPEQVKYMTRKWGRLYQDAAPQAPGTVLMTKES
jgi:hypothetical protein